MVQLELNRGSNGETENLPKTRHFFCRMNVSRNARRQMRFGDQKVSIIQLAIRIIKLKSLFSIAVCSIILNLNFYKYSKV